MKDKDNMNWPYAVAICAMWMAIGAFLYGINQCYGRVWSEPPAKELAK